MPPAPRRTASEVNVEPEVARAFETVINELGSESSRTGYDKDWVAFRAWLDSEGLSVLGIDSGDVQSYVAHMVRQGKAKATRARAISVLRAVYGRLVVARVVGSNPADDVRNPRTGGPSRTPWLEDEGEIAKLLDWRGDESWRDRRDRLCVQLVVGTGWRRSEVARVRGSDVRAGVLRGRVKGGKDVEAALPPWLEDEIRKWQEFSGVGRGYLLPRGEDDPSHISGDIVYNVVKRVAADAGLDQALVTPHALRRTLATHADRHGVPLADIQASLGHASRETTERYLKGSRRVERAPGSWMAELRDKGEAKE